MTHPLPTLSFEIHRSQNSILNATRKIIESLDANNLVRKYSVSGNKVLGVFRIKAVDYSGITVASFVFIVNGPDIRGLSVMNKKDRAPFVRALLKRELTQKEVAYALGISQALVSKLKNEGTIKAPKEMT